MFTVQPNTNVSFESVVFQNSTPFGYFPLNQGNLEEASGLATWPSIVVQPNTTVCHGWSGGCSGLHQGLQPGSCVRPVLSAAPCATPAAALNDPRAARWEVLASAQLSSPGGTLFRKTQGVQGPSVRVAWWGLPPFVAGASRQPGAAAATHAGSAVQVVFNNTVTYYYLPGVPPVRITCQQYNAKLAFAFDAAGQPYTEIANGTGILINGTYTAVQKVISTSTNQTSRCCKWPSHTHSMACRQQQHAWPGLLRSGAGAQRMEGRH